MIRTLQLLVLLTALSLFVACAPETSPDPITPSQDTATDQPADQQLGSVIDCGNSDSMMADIMTHDFDADTALQCMGQAITNCQDATSVLNNVLVGPMTFSVSNQGDDCMVTIQYPDAESIPSDELRAFANTYVTCTLFEEDMMIAEDLTDHAAVAFSVFLSISYRAESDTEYCSGTMQQLI